MNACGLSGYSNTATATTIAGTLSPTPTFTPTPTATATATATPVSTVAPPTGLTATPTPCSGITLTWTDNATDEDEYRVKMSTDGTVFTQIANNLPPNTTTWSGTLSPNTLYYLRVLCRRGSVYSDVSNTASTTTTACAPATPTATPTASPTATATATATMTPTPTVAPSSTPSGTPGKPQNLHSIKTKTLQWTLNPSTDFVSSYKINKMQGASGNYTLIGTVDGQTDHLDVSNAISGSQSTFFVTAVNDRGESPPSDKAQVQR